MSKFKVDNEQVNAAVDTLRNLLEKCEEAYEVKIPVSDVDKGQTHDELISVCENIKSTCYDFGQLIHNTILFLGEASDMFEKSDKDSAAAIVASSTEISASSITHDEKKVYTEIEIINYNSGVKKGKITYINQNNDYAYANGWGAYSGYSNGECGYACQIMALSYLGVPVSPEELCKREYTDHKIHTYWDSEANYGYDVNVFTGNSGLSVLQNLKNMVADYTNDSGVGSTSPVPIHYVYDGGMHTILLTGYDEVSNTFSALDPWSSDNNPVVRSISIDDNGKILRGGGASGTGTGQARVDGYIQYKT